MIQRRNLLIMAVLLVLCTLSLVEATFHSFPLVPHHVQQRRRRRELRAMGINTTTALEFEGGGLVQRRSRLSLDEQDRRHLRAQQVGALYQGYGTHYIDLWCGTNPPQRQTVIVDTGSAVTAFPCAGCRDHCGKDYHIDQVFDETLSPTFEQLPCNNCMRGRCTVVTGNPENDNCKIGMSYQEGSSWTAFEAKDYCYVGGPHGKPLDLTVDSIKNQKEDPKGDVDKNGESTADVDPMLAANHAFQLVFGCQTKLTGLFKTQLADGIMGMDNAHESFWHQMSAAGAMKEDIFTLCFSRQPTASRSGTEAGAMTLGGVDTRLHTSPVVYASVSVSNAFYGVHIRNVYLRQGGGGDSALTSNKDLTIKRVDISESDLNTGTTIVDSGTTDTYFTRNIATAFHALWKEMTGQTYNNNPVSLTEDQLNKLPTILFQLQGLTDVNQKLAKDSKDPIVGLVGALDPANPYDVLLAMPPSHYMEYDNDLKKYVPRFYTDEGRGSVLGANVMMGHNIIFDQVNGRLGIAESQCDYVDLVTNLGFSWTPHETYNKADHLPDQDEPDEAEEETAETVNEDEKEKEKDDEGEDKLAETPNPASSNVGESSSDGAGFCSSMGCQGSIVLALVAVIAGVVLKKVMSKSKGTPVPYSSELELADDDGEFGGGYRDEPQGEDVEEEEFQDEDAE